MQAFLLKRLGSSASSRNLGALEALRCKLEAALVPWSRMSEEDRDWWLAEHILDEYEAGGQRSSCSFLLSALAKVNPRARCRTSWKTLDVWTTEPVRQAPAAPPELLSAMFTIAVVLRRPEIGVGALLCFAGLLRVREMLTLRTEQLIHTGDSVII